MREVHRCREIARLTALTHLPLAALFLALTVVADARIKVLSLLLCAGLMMFLLPTAHGSAPSGSADEAAHLASLRETRRGFLRNVVFSTVPRLIVVGVIGALADLAFLVPALTLAYGLGGVIDWWRIERWERVHPGNALVIGPGLRAPEIRPVGA